MQVRVPSELLKLAPVPERIKRTWMTYGLETWSLCETFELLRLKQPRRRMLSRRVGGSLRAGLFGRAGEGSAIQGEPGSGEPVVELTAGGQSSLGEQEGRVHQVRTVRGPLLVQGVGVP